VSAEPARASRAPTAFAVGRLRLTDFRGYAGLDLRVPATPIVLVGANGAGKTNLLEALSLLAPGRGLRGARLAEIGRFGAGPWAVHAEIAGPRGAIAIGTGLAPADLAEEDDDDLEASGRRVLRIDGKPARGAQALARTVAALWLTPEMDRLLLDSASARRRFVDRLVVSLEPEHARRLSAYQKALRERTRILRETPSAASWLDAIEATLAETGVALAAARNAAIADLGRELIQAAGPFPRAAVALEGGIESALALRPALAVEDEFRRLLAAGRSRDAETGGAAEGPHRTDLAVRYVDKDRPAALCSTGEQKALLLSLTLAQVELVTARRGGAPVLLLDEVVAHLDADRRAALFDRLAALGCQAWMTGTDAALFAPLAGRAVQFAVAAARLEAMS